MSNFCPSCGTQVTPDQRFCGGCGASVNTETSQQTIASPHEALAANPGAATAELAGRSCPYCRFPLKEGAAVAACPACNAVHHAACYTENGGCAVAGCPGGPLPPGFPETASDYATAPLPPVAPRPQATKIQLSEPQSVPQPAGQSGAPPTRRHRLAGTIAVAAVAALLLAGGAAAAIVLSAGGSTARRAGISPPAKAPQQTPQPQQSPAQPSPAPGKTGAAATPPYNEGDFTATPPSGWQLNEDGQQMQGYVESKWRDPANPDNLVKVDMSPPSGLPPDQAAASVRAQVQPERGYQEVSFGPGSLANATSTEWIFQVPGSERVDWFFTLCGHDFAVLGSTSPSNFSQLMPTFQSFASSVQGTCGQ